MSKLAHPEMSTSKEIFRGGHILNTVWKELTNSLLYDCRSFVTKYVMLSAASCSAVSNFSPKVNTQDFLQVFQCSRMGKMEDNLTSADPLSYITNGSRVRPGCT